MQNILVPQVGHLPFIAFLLFFIVTSFASFISFLDLHLTQYPCAIFPPPFFLALLCKAVNWVLGVFFSLRAHSFASLRTGSEARRAEGSKEILRRFVPPFPKKGRDFAPQDEGSKDAKNSPTPQLIKRHNFIIITLNCQYIRILGYIFNPIGSAQPAGWEAFLTQAGMVSLCLAGLRKDVPRLRSGLL